MLIVDMLAGMLRLPANRASVWRIAVFSRCFVFILQVVANFVPDHNADAYTPEEAPYVGFFDWFLRSAVDGFHKWDAKYYVSVADEGYTTPQTFAFFPLFPVMLRGLGDAFSSLFPFLSFLTCALVSATLLNAILFTGAACTLFDLTFFIFQSTKFAYVVSILFSFNPASIFFSSVYTESLFAFLVFKGLLAIQKKETLKASLWFMLGSFTRSNGTINMGFVAYFGIANMLLDLGNGRKVFVILKWICKLLFLCSLIFLPFVLVNLHGYIVYCTYNLWTLSCSEAPTWCCEYPPSIYNHIQKHNWGLGLFKYYKLRKIPNFLLATPTVILCLYGAFIYLTSNANEILCLGLNFSLPNSSKSKQKVAGNLYFTVKNIFCYTVHTVFLVTFALLFMHVEVVTRMVMSSTPFPYWVAASFIYNDLHSYDKYHLSTSYFKFLSVKSKVIVLYFVSYLLCGTILHVNFLPWT